jgi:hypothetical protein
MHLTGFWQGFLADSGNKPGAQQGDVTITLIQPVGGVSTTTVPSDSVHVAAEAGNLIAVQVVLPDGRHLFVPASNVAGIIDAPAGAAKPEPKRVAGK